MKPNVYVDLSINARAGASGVVLHDDHGEFLVACRSNIAYAAHDPSAEARAVYDGLRTFF